jgi:signal transduction histidine kinase
MKASNELYETSQELNPALEARAAERTRVAQELHDTLLQGVLSASMQLHAAADELPEDSPVRPALNRILELMGQVIEETRSVLLGLRSSMDKVQDLETSFLRVPQELSLQQRVDFRVVVRGASRPLRPAVRDEVYRIGREALINAFRHSRANHIELELEYAVKQLRVLVRDDGCGIGRRILRSGRSRHWGLSGMRERAARIGARLKILNRSGSGAEVELRVPSGIAFDSRPSGLAPESRTVLYARDAGLAELKSKKRVG